MALRINPTRGGPIASAGFSLIELLVVVVVVGVLASLLLPALSAAKSRASSIKCRSNLRQLGIQLQIYVGEYGAYPSMECVETNLLGTGVYAVLGVDGRVQLLDLGEPGARVCPTRKPRRQDATMFTSGGASTSYGYNGFGYVRRNSGEVHGLAGGVGMDGLDYHVTEGEVRNPADMIAVGDGLALVTARDSGLPADTVIEWDQGLLRQEAFSIGQVGVQEWVDRAKARHQSRGNVVFCDGHVEAVRFSRLFLDRDDAALRRWNRDNEAHR